ncbi:DUF423 domain-containing protein [uncultured Paludibaculum sp.]|uniref:DUF423 domain-containing protein n=1 Tax=uncultured Paludibaculum sp. TaxID=1765020 RepID=UPI002AABDDBB|nr:DUF423 domain-containing protein [uncultured Paludibaculum sp.]
MPWSAIAAFLLALAVGLGAFGAHGLKDHLDAYRMGIWERAVLYHFFHALGLLAVPLFAKQGLLPDSAADRISLLLFAGVLLFSGSLYVLALTGVRTLGVVTPFGGIAFIAAWLYLAVALLRGR